jgi:glycosyltransferase involved in cell wall biosynthesis
MISVIVCTADRAEQLEACFESFALARAEAPRDWELIVVDNGDSGATRDAVERRASRGDLPLRYVAEPRRGLSRARNTGVASARHPIVAFTDDDCRVAPNWLAEIAAAFSNSDIGVLGGRVTLYDSADAAVSIRPFTKPATIASLDDILLRLIGCNMAMRASVFGVVGAFDERLGAGTSLRAAEDFDFFYRCLKRGVTVRYSPLLHVQHAHGRRPGPALDELAKGYVEGRGAFYFKHALRGDPTALKHLYWELRSSHAADPGRWTTHRRLFSGGLRYILRG